MSLTLQVISNKGLALAAPLVFQVGPSGGVIGRSPENEFVLPDPEKFVSRRHGVLKFENGEFYFADTSAAGTYFSNRDLLLQHDTIVLEDGDRLRIGNYELLVRKELQEEAQGGFFREEPEPWPPAEQAPEPRRFSPNASFDPFKDGDPFGFDAPVEPEPQGPSFLGQPDVAPVHANFVPPQAVSDLSDLSIEDLLNDLETPEAGPRPSADRALEQLPEELFSEYLSGLVPSGSSGPAVFPDIPPLDVPEATASVDFGRPDLPAVSAAAGADRAEVPSPIPFPGGASPAPPEASGPSLPVQPSAATTAASNREPPELGRQPAAGPAASPDESLRRFLEGAGIGDLPPIGDGEIPALMKTLGLLFHDLVDGMMTVLRARAEEKRELRVDVTTMKAVNNNPLKAVPTARDALRIMLAARDPGFIHPVEAVREGFRDLMSHQLATTAGMQASLSEQLERFDPANFEKFYSEGIVFQRKAKCWDAYSQAYPGLVRDVLENFFGDKFREVYEQQIRTFRSGPERGDQ